MRSVSRALAHGAPQIVHGLRFCATLRELSMDPERLSVSILGGVVVHAGSL